MHKRIVILIAALTGVLLLFFAQYIWKQNLYWLNRNTVLYTHYQEKGLSSLQPNMLIIPSLHIIAPIQHASSTEESEFQRLLQHGVVHYSNTAEPGEYGNCYVFGHSSDYLWSGGDYKTIFATLPHIAMGSVVYLTDSKGVIYTYKVIETKVVFPENISVLSQPQNKKLLTFQTSYPLGMAFKRFIVTAELQE